MARKIFYYVVFVLFFIFILSACSNENNDDTPSESEETSETESEEASVDESEEEPEEEDTNESDQQTVSHLNLLDEESSPVDACNFALVEFELTTSPTDYYDSDVANEVVIFESNDWNVLIDYETGEGFELESDLESHQVDGEAISGDSHTERFLFGDKYYVTLYNQGDPLLAEVDLNTGAVEPLINIDTESLITKQDDILYILEGDANLFALDLETKDKLWEESIDPEVYGYPSLHVTENAILLKSFYGLYAYSIDDGELLYEEDDNYYAINVDDGETFYALIDKEEGTSAELAVLEFNDMDGKQGELFEMPTIEMPYEEYRLNVELIDDIFYVHFESGIFAYDANTYDHLWTISVGDNLEDRRDTDDDYDYEFYSTSGQDYIYTVIEKTNTARDRDAFISVIDAKTADVVEHYSLGEGRTSGPFVDPESEKAFMYFRDLDDDPNAEAYFMPFN